ncbi:hypothetical protein FGO68_gene9242 [Halteria grandinella]|uniref:Uncharacterized protein n=1 Tax=Halteria grandinella TaxID=5974 RepID=A0A8J8T3K9_HALGN|nr:hypothetical protein FGO68_gene9242 [Halteria grandinella]
MYPQLFDVQRCKVIASLNKIKLEQQIKLLKDFFPQNQIELLLELTSEPKEQEDFNIDKDSLKGCITRISCNENFKFPMIDENIPIQSFKMKRSKYQEQILDFSSLSKFIIFDQIHLKIGSNLQIRQQNAQNAYISSPKKVTLESVNRKVDWPILMNQILERFTNQENMSDLHMSSKCGLRIHQSSLTSSLFKSVQNFVNLKILTTPFGCESLMIDQLLQMLRELKKLKQLTLNSTDNNQDQQECIAVEQISLFVISSKQELRTLNFMLSNKIMLGDIEIKDRVAPLTITIDVYCQYTQYVIDTETGQTKFYRIKDNNEY